MPRTNFVGPKKFRTVSYRHADGTVMDATVREVRGEAQQVSITGSPTGGTFTLTFDGETTDDIAFDATAAAVKTALEALSNVGVGNVSASGGALPATAVTVTFVGEYGGVNVAEMTADGGGLTGGTTPAATVSTTTAASQTALDLRVPHLPVADREKTGIAKRTALKQTDVWF